jgi:hypothetical protein
MRCKRCYMPFLFARSSLINYSMPALIAVISAWPRALRGVRIGSSARIRAGRGDNRNTRSPRRIASSTLTQRSQGSRTRFLANPFEQLPNDSQPTTHRRQHCRFLCRSSYSAIPWAFRRRVVQLRQNASILEQGCAGLTTMRPPFGDRPATALGYFGSGSASILSIGRLPALIPTNSRPSSFVEIIQQHLRAHFCDGNRPGEFDAPCEDEAQYERVHATGDPPTNRLGD